MQSPPESRRLQQATNDIEALYDPMSDTRDRVDKISAKLLEHDGHFKQIDERFEQIDGRFKQIDERFEQIDGRFKQIDGRFEQIDGRFERVDTELGGLRTDVRQILEILKSR